MGSLKCKTKLQVRLQNEIWLFNNRFAKTHHVRTQCQRKFSSRIDSSINNPTNYHNTTAKSWVVCFSEACQMSTSARMFIECHWSACTGSHLAENHHLTRSWCTYAMDLPIFCDIVSAIGPYSRPFHSENCWALL